MKSSDKSNLIIEEANGIINSLIKKNTVPEKNNKKLILLAILTMSLVMILALIIRII